MNHVVKHLPTKVAAQKTQSSCPTYMQISSSSLAYYSSPHLFLDLTVYIDIPLWSSTARFKQHSNRTVFI